MSSPDPLAFLRQDRPQALHWVLVWPSLLVLTLGVAFPGWLLLVGVLTLLALAWSGFRIDHLPISDAEATVALCCAFVLLLIAAARELRAKPPLGPLPGSRLRAWWSRHPWWRLGLILGVAYAIVVPPFHRHATWPLLAAITIFTSSGWLAGTASWVCYRFARATVAMVWRKAIASNVVAAVLVACATALVIALAGAVEETPGRAEALASEAGQRFGLPQPSVGASSDGFSLFGTGSTSGESGFGACMESAPESLRQRAARAASAFVGSDEAMDVVRQVLLNFCARGVIPGQKPDYFYTSVRNLAIDWNRKGGSVRERRSQESCLRSLIPPQC